MADIDMGLIAIAASIAAGLGGLGTAWAQKEIGPAAIGAMAENPALFGKGLTMLVIPETIVLFGFAIAFLLMGYMP